MLIMEADIAYIAKTHPDSHCRPSLLPGIWVRFFASRAI
jgi:hypothetical protein